MPRRRRPIVSSPTDTSHSWGRPEGRQPVGSPTQFTAASRTSTAANRAPGHRVTPRIRAPGVHMKRSQRAAPAQHAAGRDAGYPPTRGRPRRPATTPTQPPAGRPRHPRARVGRWQRPAVVAATSSTDRRTPDAGRAMSAPPHGYFGNVVDEYERSEAQTAYDQENRLGPRQRHRLLAESSGGNGNTAFWPHDSHSAQVSLPGRPGRLDDQ